MILGIDEVGRGPWAGPLVVGAVVLGDIQIDGLTDSKKLSKAKRELLNTLILSGAAGVGLGWVHADEIDQIGLSAALRQATIRAVSQVTAAYHEIIIDGTINFLADTTKGQYVSTLKKADLLIASVSAASIVAKVARDAYMAEQARMYPDYGFDEHVGYGTAKHRAAIERLGVTPLHRLSFAPLKQYAEPQSSTPSESDSTTTVGQMAESHVATYLELLGHQVIERNWRTKYCEIDIVSKKDDELYFTEVKYRRTARHGDSIDAISPRKLRQMKFAAELFAAHHRLQSVPLRLAVAGMRTNDTVPYVYLEIN